MSNQYLSLTPQDRREQLMRALKGAADSLVTAAEVFASMQGAGDDTSFVPRQVKIALGRIAARTMLPEVMLEMGGSLRNRVMMLPVSEQREIIDGKLINVILSGDRTKAIPARELTPGEVKQVFTETGALRDLDEQRVWLTSRIEGGKSNLPRARIILDSGMVRVTAGVLSKDDIRTLALSLRDDE